MLESDVHLTSRLERRLEYLKVFSFSGPYIFQGCCAIGPFRILVLLLFLLVVLLVLLLLLLVLLVVLLLVLLIV